MLATLQSAVMYTRSDPGLKLTKSKSDSDLEWVADEKLRQGAHHKKQNRKVSITKNSLYKYI